MAEPEAISRSRGAEAILDCISDGVITIDLQKRVTFLNRAMQTMLSYEVPDSGTLLACDVLIQSNICSSQDCVWSVHFEENGCRILRPSFVVGMASRCP